MKKKSKFLLFMSRLSATELARFEKYLLLEYPKEGNALKVFDYYRRFFPGKEQPDRMELTYAFRKIYGVEMGPEMSDPKKIWNAFSSLYGWLKDFLIVEKLKSDRFTSDVLWLEILQEKKLNAEHAKHAIEAYQTKYGDYQDYKACQQQLEIGKQYKLQLTLDRPVPDYNAIEPCIKKIQQNAELIRLQMECEWLTIKGMRPSKTPEKPAPEEPPMYIIYKQIEQMLLTKGTEHFEALQKLLQVHASHISPAANDDILRYLHYHAGRMFRESDDKIWAQKLHPLNKALLEKEGNSPKKEMSGAQFQNIVSVGCLVQDFDWLGHFIKDYARFLPAKTREENVQVALAGVAWTRKDYRKVYELTNTKLVFKDEVQLLRIKTVQFRAMYELGMDPSDAVNAYQIYLIRHREPYAAYKESAISFLTVFDLLIQKKESKSYLKQALAAHPQIFLRSWLEEKIATYQSAIYRRSK